MGWKPGGPAGLLSNEQMPEVRRDCVLSVSRSAVLRPAEHVSVVWYNFFEVMLDYFCKDVILRGLFFF